MRLRKRQRRWTFLVRSALSTTPKPARAWSRVRRRPIQSAMNNEEFEREALAIFRKMGVTFREASTEEQEGEAIRDGQQAIAELCLKYVVGEVVSKHLVPMFGLRPPEDPEDELESNDARSEENP